jgi:hypothetical protein
MFIENMGYKKVKYIRQSFQFIYYRKIFYKEILLYLAYIVKNIKC